MAAQSTTTITKTPAYGGFDVYKSVSTGSSSTSIFTPTLAGFSGDGVLVGTFTPAASLTITNNYVYIDASMDGTNWGAITDKTFTTSGTGTDTRSFVFDLSGIKAPYLRVRIVCNSYSSTVAWQYCIAQ